MKKTSVLLICVFMILACGIFASWLRCQESYQDSKGRWALRYTSAETLWKKIDYSTFLTLNGTMNANPVMQRIWGISNHRAFDLFAAAWMVMLFVIYYIRNPRNEDRVVLIQYGLYMTVTLLLVSMISELTIHFQRLSPGSTEELRSRAILLTDLKDVVKWKVKISSNNSFPGDHSMVLMMIGSYIIYRLRSWYGWAAALGMVLFALPRLAGGGHWISDIAAGGLFFYLFFSRFVCSARSATGEWTGCANRPAGFMQDCVFWKNALRDFRPLILRSGYRSYESEE